MFTFQLHAISEHRWYLLSQCHAIQNRDDAYFPNSMLFRTELMLAFPAQCHSFVLQNRADASFPCSMSFLCLAEQSWCLLSLLHVIPLSGRTELMLTFPAPWSFHYLAEQSWCWASLPGVSLAPSSHRVSHQKIITAQEKGNKKPKQIWTCTFMVSHFATFRSS